MQCRFTKRLPRLQYLDYFQLLNILKLDNLELRRLTADMILLYKIYFGKIQTDFSKFIEPHSYTSTRGHPYKLRVPYARTNIFKYYFIRSFSIWNPLSLIVILAVYPMSTCIHSSSSSFIVHFPCYAQVGRS